MTCNEEKFKEFFPEDLSESECLKVVRENPLTLKSIPLEQRTERVCQEAIKNITPYNDDIKVLYHVPHVDLIYDNLEKLGDRFGIEVIFDSMNPRTLEVDKIIDWGISRDADCLRYIPSEKHTPKRLEKAIENFGLSFFRFNTVDKDILLKPGMVDKGVRAKELSFMCIPENLITAEHCLLQEKLYPDFFKQRPYCVPNSVTNSLNVFTLNEMLGLFTKQKLTFENVKDIYNGKTLEIGNETFYFDRGNGRLEVDASFAIRKEDIPKPPRGIRM